MSRTIPMPPKRSDKRLKRLHADFDSKFDSKDSMFESVDEQQVIFARSAGDGSLGAESENFSGSVDEDDTDPGNRADSEGDQPRVETLDETNHTSSTFVYSTLFALAAIVALIAVLAYAFTSKDLNEADSTIDYIDIYEKGMQNLQINFTSQTPRFWKYLKFRGLAHLRNRSPTQPLVFLLAAAPNAHDVVDCFATKLAELLDPQNVQNLAKFNGQNHHGNQGDTTKKILDQFLCDTFGKGKKAALVYQLHLLPPPSPMMFHSFCDDQNAPYKRAAFIFTVHLPWNPDSSLSAVEAEGTVEKYLSEEVWVDSPYDPDKIAALLSRIADTVLLVSPEESSTLDALCTV